MAEYDDQGRQLFQLDAWPEDPVVCTWHRRYLPCRRCYDDPREGSWSNQLSDVLAVDRYQQGQEGDEDDFA